jgi:hypothetical protein
LVQQQKQKEEGERIVVTFLAKNLTKFKLFYFCTATEKTEQVDKELYYCLSKKLSVSSRVLGSEIRDLEQTYSGSRIQGPKSYFSSLLR